MTVERVIPSLISPSEARALTIEHSEKDIDELNDMIRAQAIAGHMAFEMSSTDLRKVALLKAAGYCVTAENRSHAAPYCYYKVSWAPASEP